MKKIVYYVICLLCLAGVDAYSQSVTSAGLTGLVTDEISGEKLEMATVSLKHVPTNTVYHQRTNISGRFNFVNLIVGGPYELKVTFVGYAPYRQDGLQLKLGQNRNFDINMKLTQKQTGEVVVIADQNKIINRGKTGSSQYVSEDEITTLPTIDRSLNDFARLSPLLVSTGSSTSDAGISAGGRSSRYNNVQVDGSSINDVYGLNASGTPGGGAETQPVSLDAIQEFDVAVSPFDIREGNFTGASINAITRSGSNKFSGSAYALGKNQHLVSNKPSEYPEFNDYTLGMRIGGPVVKDKLFYFANAEYCNKSIPQDLLVSSALDSNASNQFFIDPSILTAIRDTVKNRYGYDVGSAGDYTRNVYNLKLFARFDYNINDKNRLTLRHNYINAVSDNGVTRTGSLFSFSGQEYLYKSIQNSTVLQLNSVIGDNMANEFRASASFVRDDRDYGSSGDAFPCVIIQGVGNKSSKISFGVERSAQANYLYQDIFGITDNFNFFIGDHALTIGTSDQYFHFDNLFLNNYMGAWTFHSYDDFLAGIPNKFESTYSKDINNAQPAVTFGYTQLGFYAQDNWAVRPNFHITYGIRYDLYAFSDDPGFNEIFAKTFAGYSTSEMPSPSAFSPRVGFNWDVFNNDQLQLRGGIGLFGGPTQGVWLGNQYIYTGLYTATAYMTKNLPTFDPANWKQLSDSLSALTTNQKSEIAITDKDFQMPQVLRLNIAADYELGNTGIVATGEFIYGKSINEAMFQNLNLAVMADSNGNLIYSADGRPMYNKLNSNNFQNVIFLTNTDEGYQCTFATQLQKPFDKGILPDFSMNLSYSKMIAKDVTTTINTVASSCWKYLPTVDPNNPDLVTSSAQIDNRIMANISWKHNWSQATSTSIGVYYEGRSGNPFSFMFYTNNASKALSRTATIKDVNNDDVWGNDVVYIPGILSSSNGWSDDNMILVNGGVQDTILNSGKTYGQLFEEFISEFDQAERGKISERNQFRTPWINNLDLRISQLLKIHNDYKVEISLDIMNVLNLINSDWGDYKYIAYGTSSLLEFDGYEIENDPTSRIKASYYPNAAGNSKDKIFAKSDLWSRWRMQLGVRLYF